MSGRDLMSCAQTGSGKTAAFLLPIPNKLIERQADSNAVAMVQTPQCVVITPTRELAMQVEEIDEYVHRIGRTGRVGNLGKARFAQAKFKIW